MPSQPETTRLERAEAAGNDHGARVEARVARGAQQERMIRQHLQLGHFLAHVELRVERLRLLQQAVDQLLRAAHGQRGNVIDRLLGIQLAALAAGMLERVDDVGANAQQAELEDLEQAAGAGADDDRIGLDGAVDAVGCRATLLTLALKTALSSSNTGRWQNSRSRAAILHKPRPGSSTLRAGFRHG